MKARRIGGGVCAAAGAVWLVAAQPAAKPPSHDWPQFRGANRDGVSQEAGLLGAWPAEGPRQVWRVPLGPGFSAISVVGQRLYTMFAGDREGQATEFAAAFDAASGKEIWRTPIGKRFDDTFGNGPRSTPTVQAGKVYVLGSYGDLAALSAVDGAVEWRVSLTEAFASKVPTFGFSTSALVDDGLVVIEGGGKEGKCYAGLDAATGQVRWTFGNGTDEPGYSSPIAITMGGAKRYVYVVGDSMKAIDGQGAEIWSHPWTHPGETHAMPVFIPPDRIFASGAEGVGASLLRLTMNGEVSAAEELWKTRSMRNHFSSSVVHGGSIYGFDNATLRCISLASGEAAWSQRGLGKGSLILAGDRLYVLSDLGKLVLVEATPAGYHERGSVQALQGRSWTAPALANGRIYLRNHDQMVSYELKR